LGEPIEEVDTAPMGSTGDSQNVLNKQDTRKFVNQVHARRWHQIFATEEDHSRTV